MQVACGNTDERYLDLRYSDLRSSSFLLLIVLDLLLLNKLVKFSEKMCMDEEPVDCTSEKAVTLTAVTQSHSSVCLIPLEKKKK